MNCPFCEKLLDDVALLTNVCSSCHEILGEINKTMRTIRITPLAQKKITDVAERAIPKSPAPKILKAQTLSINQRKIAAQGKSNATTDYELQDKIGEGGMGTVHGAQQNSLGRIVAVKLLNDKTPASAKNFTREAAVIGNLEHPNIVPVYDLGLDEQGHPFYAMKRVLGSSWSDELEKRSLPENIEVLMRVCDAVAYAHSKNIIHRDIKPENVMLGEFGEVMLMDWGLAAGMIDGLLAPRVRYEDAIAGTPAYMAPEMARGEENNIGFHSDIYLLGAILFEIVTGEQPHTGKNIRDCLANAACNKIVVAWVESELLSTAKKAMHENPRARFKSVIEFQNAIQQHTRSIIAATHARQARVRARKTGSYLDYFQATGGFLEALNLWNDNTVAQRELQELAAEFADLAQKNGDEHLAKTLIATRKSPDAT